MKARWIWALVVALALGMFVVTTADEGAAKEVTVKGEILDMSCYIARGAKGDEHAGCAKKCVKAGQPMGLLAEDGSVYLLYASHKDGAPFEQAKDYAGQQVELTGAETDRAGIKGIEVHGVKAI